MNFDHKAKHWDTPTRCARAKVLAHAIANTCQHPQSINALEIGCGSGLIACELHHVFNTIYCADPSKEMIHALQTKIDQNHYNSIKTYEIDLLYSEAFTQTFDLLYSSMVFHHMSDIQLELKRQHRLLSDNGTLIIIDLDKEDGRFHQDEKEFNGHNGFDREQFKTQLEAAAFKNIQFNTVYRGIKQLENDTVDYTLFMCKATK